MNALAAVHERRVVRVRTGASDHYQLAQAISLADFPTFHLEDAEGRGYTWAVHFCTDATTEEEVEYWRKRAATAEAKLKESERL